MSDTEKTEEKVVKNYVTGKKEVTYVYAIFLTPFGKGYGCYAIKSTDKPNTFLVGASYCHPSDRKNFRKKLGRDIAIGRATTEYSFDPELKVDTINIITHVLRNAEMPYWAERAYNIGSFSFKLSADRYNNTKLLEKLIEADFVVESGFLTWTLQLLKQHNLNGCKNHPV